MHDQCHSPFGTDGLLVLAGTRYLSVAGPRPPGPHFYRIYRGLQSQPKFEQFNKVLEDQGLPKSSKRMFKHLQKLYKHNVAHYLPMNQFDMDLKARKGTWTPDRIADLVASSAPERRDLEYKSQVDKNSFAKSLAAMANSGGGHIIVGIHEGDGLTAQPIETAGFEERLQQLNQGIDPELEIQFVRLDTKSVGEVAVVKVGPAYTGIVHLFHHKAAVRKGSTTSYMSSEEIRRWVMEGTAEAA